KSTWQAARCGVRSLRCLWRRSTPGGRGATAAGSNRRRPRRSALVARLQIGTGELAVAILVEECERAGMARPAGLDLGAAQAAITVGIGLGEFRLEPLHALGRESAAALVGCGVQL